MSLSQIALNNIGHLRRMKNRLNGDIMHVDSKDNTRRSCVEKYNTHAFDSNHLLSTHVINYLSFISRELKERKW